MPKQTFVVKFDENTELYLMGFSGGITYEDAIWSSPNNAMEYDTLEAAQSEAARINSGTVGTTKPQS